MRIWLEVETAAGVRTGRIDNLLYWRNLPRLSKAGTIEFAIPAGDPKATLLVNKRRVACYGILNGAVAELGRGVVEELETQSVAGQPPILVARGGDVLRELAIHSTLSTSPNVPVEFDDVNNAPSTIITTFAGVGRMPAAWSLGGASTTTTNVYLRSWHDSVLSILLGIAEATGEHVRAGTGRQLYWLGPASTFASSGILATTHGDPVAIEGNPNACLITKITRLSDSWDQWNRIYLFGAGEAEARLDLRAVTLWPLGFVDTTSAGTTMTFTANVATAAYGGETWTVDRTQGYLENTTRATADGYLMHPLPIKNIAPLSNTDADLADAANMLLKTGYNWLRTRTTAQSFYRLTVTALDALLLPGQTVRTMARGVYEDETGKRLWLDIDENLIVLEPEQEIDERGIRTVALTVASTDRWPETDESAVVAPLQQSIIMQALPQLNASVDTLSYQDEFDDTIAAVLPFWLGEEYVTINQVLLRFTVDPLRSTIVGNDSESAHTHGIPIYGVNDPSTEPDTLSRIVYANAGDDQFYAQFGTGSDEVSTTAAGSAHTHGATYGIFEDSGGAVVGTSSAIALDADVDIECNGTAITYLTPITKITGTSNDWFEVDLTAIVADATTRRPNQEDNEVTIIGASGKQGRITAQLQIRGVIQSVAIL